MDEDYDYDYDEFWAGYSDWSATEQEEWEAKRKKEVICPICGTEWEDKYEMYVCPCQDKIGGLHEDSM